MQQVGVNRAIPNNMMNPRMRPILNQMRPQIRKGETGDANRESLYQEKLRQIKAGVPTQGIETRIYYDREVCGEEDNPDSLEMKDTAKRFQLNNKLMNVLLSQRPGESEGSSSVGDVVAAAEERLGVEESSLGGMRSRQQERVALWKRRLSDLTQSVRGLSHDIPKFENCKRVRRDDFSVVLEGERVSPPREEEMSGVALTALAPRVNRYRVPIVMDQPRPEGERFPDPYGPRFIDPNQWSTRPPRQRPQGYGRPFYPGFIPRGRVVPECYGGMGFPRGPVPPHPSMVPPQFGMPQGGYYPMRPEWVHPQQMMPGGNPYERFRMQSDCGNGVTDPYSSFM